MALNTRKSSREISTTADNILNRSFIAVDDDLSFRKTWLLQGESPQCLRSIVTVLSLALIGNASAQKFPGRRVGPEAFSMRRQVGSRWRLRRTRLAMGFEWRFS